MPEDITGGSYNPDEPDEAVDQVADYIDKMDMPPAKVPPIDIQAAIDATRGDVSSGPSGVGFRGELDAKKTSETPWAGRYLRPVGMADPEIRDDRSNLEYQGSYLPHMPDQTPENRALLQVLDMRKYGDDPFQSDRGYDPRQLPAVTPLAAQLGVHDFDKQYANLGKFVMPDPMRDDYLTLADVNTVKGRPIPTYDEFKAEAAAEAQMNKAIQNTPDEWEGKDFPTQKDIDTLRDYPSDEMVALFEEQFGEGTAEPYVKMNDQDYVPEKVPLPRRRPSEPAELPPITVEKKKRK